MAVHFPKNQYRGINAHLNSFLQNIPGEWESFHASHIVDMTRLLNKHLPPGYEARVEKSLQIREIRPGEPNPIQKRRSPQPDTTIVSLDPSRPRSDLPSRVYATSELTLPVVETMDIDPEDLLNAAVIYNIDEDTLMGRPVTRIELLSPTNKPPYEGYAHYRDKRNATLDSGMPLVEIDYLHQTPPVVKNVPRYPEPGSYPYSIIVNDPRPSTKDGVSRIHGFGVDVPFPLVDIPLEHGEAIAQLDFGVAYTITFEETPTYQRIVDYEQEPLEFHTYRADDQQIIRELMRHMVAAARQS